MRAQKNMPLSPRAQGRYAAYHDLCLEYEGRSQPIPVRAPDISPQGMFINTAQFFAEGAVVKVSFRLGNGVEVGARGEVRYCLAGVGIGVEFLDISPEAQRAIAEQCERGSR